MRTLTAACASYKRPARQTAAEIADERALFSK
jgi:hypothetical protein